MATSLLDRAKEFQKDLELLDREVENLKRQYDLYFAGVNPRQPYDLKRRVDQVIKKHRHSPIGKLDLMFRFESLVARYASYCDYWDKVFKAREADPKATVPFRLGMGAPGAPAANGTAPAAEPSREEAARSAAAAAAASQASSADNNHDRLRKVYEEFVAAKKALGQSVDNLQFDNFRSLLVKQASKIKEKSQCADVSFSISIADGKVNLKAKPVK